MTEENRILVNVGNTTIMLNSRNPFFGEKQELVLKGLCHTLEGVDKTNDWDDLARHMIEFAELKTQ